MQAQDPTYTRILESAEQLFFRYGIRSISMDEVARSLAVSKKTLYQHFENKDELIYAIGKKRIEADCQKWKDLNQANRSALEEMLVVTYMLRKELSAHNPIIIHELKRFHPRVWKLFEEQRESTFEDSIMQNLRKGIDEGCYRPEINLKVLARFRFMMVTMSFDPEIFPPNEFVFMTVQEQMLEHFVRGLLTEKGQRKWEKLKSRSDGPDSLDFLSTPAIA